MGEPLPIERAGDVIFGIALVNDWSARDIQRWEYQPLGPFLSKSFATSMAAWVTPMEALEHARVEQREQDPPPMDYLRTDERWALDIDLEVELNDTVISRTNAAGLYWTMAQQLAHATVNGANVRAGDLYASGTISGPEPGTYGSLLELSWGGRDPVVLHDGTERTFLEDGDTLVLRGRAGRIALGDVAGTIIPVTVRLARRRAHDPLRPRPARPGGRAARRARVHAADDGAGRRRGAARRRGGGRAARRPPRPGRRDRRRAARHRPG